SCTLARLPARFRVAWESSANRPREARYRQASRQSLCGRGEDGSLAGQIQALSVAPPTRAGAAGWQPVAMQLRPFRMWMLTSSPWWTPAQAAGSAPGGFSVEVREHRSVRTRRSGDMRSAVVHQPDLAAN